MCLCVQIKNEKLFSSLIYIFFGDRFPHIQNSELRLMILKYGCDKYPSNLFTL